MNRRNFIKCGLASLVGSEVLVHNIDNAYALPPPMIIPPSQFHPLNKQVRGLEHSDIDSLIAHYPNLNTSEKIAIGLFVVLGIPSVIFMGLVGYESYDSIRSAWKTYKNNC